jgi:midasin
MQAKDEGSNELQNDDNTNVKPDDATDQKPIEDKRDEETELINEDTPEKHEDAHGMMFLNLGVDVKPIDDLHEDENKSEGETQDEGEDLPEDMVLDGEDEAMDDNDGQDEAGQEESAQVKELPTEKDSEMPLEDEADANELPEVEQVSSEKDEEMDVEGEEPETADTSMPDALANGLTDEEKLPEPEPELESANQAMNKQQEQADQSSSQPFGVEGEAGDKSAESMDQQDNQNASSDKESGEQDKCNMDSSNDQDTQPMKQDQAENDDLGSRNMESNPHRSVGNATEKWHSRLKNISDAVNDRKESVQEDVDMQNNEFEFVREDHEDQGDSQALGNANEEQLDKTDKIALADETEQEDLVPQGEESHARSEPREELLEKSTAQNDKQSKGADEKFGTEPEPVKDNEEENSAANLDQLDEVAEMKPNIDKEENTVSAVIRDFTRPMVLDELDVTTDNQDYAELRHELELRTANWMQSGSDPIIAQDLWRNYTTLTRDLAFNLCEQLRLILEPTLATKLKGDYRTGKRLNMRKIVSYIASQFKKDKIWMRRTKPSKRTYQIMISIDDSRSMSVSHSIQMAFESLAIISKAMTQLEVGDLCITSFGILHLTQAPMSS